MSLEEMGTFFNCRVKDYDNHVMSNVDGSKLYYKETAELIPRKKNIELLDLGCGTGLELDEIFLVNPDVKVTGIDIAKDMLEELKRKNKDRIGQIDLINDSYFDYEYDFGRYDVALSVQTLHHFNYDKKVLLYTKIFKCLKPDGFYIETDYMAPTQEYEDFYFSENKRIRKELGITEGFYHYDTPCTVSNQIKMLKKAGFSNINEIGKHGNTVILKATK